MQFHDDHHHEMFEGSETTAWCHSCGVPFSLPLYDLMPQFERECAEYPAPFGLY